MIQKSTLNISGMHCGACATGIQMFLSQRAGVKSIYVDYNVKKADFEYEPEKISLEEIKKAISELGYSAS